MDNKLHEYYVRPCKVRYLTFKIKRYWDAGPPMSFSDLGWSYEEKGRFRYMLQVTRLYAQFFRFDEHNGKLVVDLGCGAGIDSLEFARYGAHVISVDFSESSNALTKLLYEEAGLHHIGHVVLCDARNLPFRDRCVDVIYPFWSHTSKGL
ncbi:MAG: class I SAM-dependent methyltransferase [Nitrososphaerota archaeon]